MSSGGGPGYDTLTEPGSGSAGEAPLQDAATLGLVADVLLAGAGFRTGLDIAEIDLPTVTAVLAGFEELSEDGGEWSAVVHAAGLDAVEALVLAILIAIDTDSGRQRLVGRLLRTDRPSVATIEALGMLAPPGQAAEWQRAVGPQRGLERARLLRVDNGTSWVTSTVRAHPAVLWWLLGRQLPDDDLPAGTLALDLAGGGEERLVVTSGPDRIRRVQAAIRSLAGPGFLLISPPEHDAGWDAVIRHASLQGLGILVDTDDVLPAGTSDIIDRADHLVWGVCSAIDLPLANLPRRRWLHASVHQSRAAADEVRAFLGDAQIPADLTADQLDAVSSVYRANGGDLAGAVRRLAAGELSLFADRIVPSHTWDDLVLPADQQTLVREITARARHRRQVYDDWGFDGGARGVLAMFSGPSGTGKTLAAEVVAHDLGLDLYRVDLAQVMDKYIGETEKKLSRVFAVAEASPMVLFFDEADAILGKRSNVSDAHDRHANVEVAFLLQRLERHSGVIILATNLASNLDAAFLRRIQVSVHFAVPGPVERRLIWERCLPPAARADDLDLHELASRLELTGGQIHNIAIRSAFLAADGGTLIGHHTLLQAAAREMQKAGRMFRAEDFPAG